MAESKMKEVAKILGVELGEEFKIKDNKGTYKLTDSGLLDMNSYLCTYFLNYLLSGKLEIEKPILDKVEKHYLENVLRPFKDRVVYVIKKNYSNTEEYLFIRLEGYVYFYLPYFKKNTMYKGMELDKEYTLKELGLFEK